MADILENGTPVYTGPQPDAPILEPATADAPAVYGERPPRPTGIIVGNQALDPNEVSYLVVKEGGGNEWFPARVIEPIN